jgi:signal transduction histidine kinase
MARGFALLAVPLKLLLFLAGILLATLVLAIIGFRSVKNEAWIAEKNYEASRISLKSAVLETYKAEMEGIVDEVKQKFSTGEDFMYDSMPGILSVFTFKDGILLYPRISEEYSGEIYLLETAEALALKEFLDMQAAGKFEQGKKYALSMVSAFMQNPSLMRLDWDSYVLEKMLSDILSRENLSRDEREKIWEALNETKRVARNLSIYREHKDFLLSLGNYACYSNENYFYIHNDGKIFLALSYFELTAKNAIVVAVDSVFYAEKLSKAVKETAKEWSYIPFSISGDFPFGQWDMVIEETSRTTHEESQKRIFFLYLMLVFSLIIPVIGVVVVYRGFSRERALRLMKDNFLSTISHELKTPLTSVKMYSELMNSGRVSKPEKIISYTGVILKETNRLEGLIDAILNYTRMESGKKVFRWESLNLSECVEKVCDSLDGIAPGKGLELKMEIAAGCMITGDYPSIYSLVQNLVDNAIKYTKEGYVFVRLQQDAQSISLSVEDTGKGIPASEQNNIFEGFYRIGDESTRETKGSGLGLAIVKRTADSHKAAIVLKSSPGKGSTFTVVFKLSTLPDR